MKTLELPYDEEVRLAVTGWSGTRPLACLEVCNSLRCETGATAEVDGRLKSSKISIDIIRYLIRYLVRAFGGDDSDSDSDSNAEEAQGEGLDTSSSVLVSG